MTSFQKFKAKTMVEQEVDHFLEFGFKNSFNTQKYPII